MAIRKITLADLHPGSFWIVGNTPYPINMRVGSTWGDNEYIRPGEYLLVLGVDRDGDPQEVFGGNTSLDQVFQLIDRLDRESGYHPHSAWRRCAGGFTRVFERVGKDPK